MLLVHYVIVLGFACSSISHNQKQGSTDHLHILIFHFAEMYFPTCTACWIVGEIENVFHSANLTYHQSFLTFTITLFTLKVLMYLKILMVKHGESSPGSYLADPTSPIPSQCAVIMLFKIRSQCINCRDKHFKSKCYTCIWYSQLSNISGHFCVSKGNLFSFMGQDRVAVYLRHKQIITSLAKEVMFLVALVCLFVCLFVCLWTLLKNLWTDWSEILWRDPG